MSIGALAVRLGDKATLGDKVVDELALVARHRGERGLRRTLVQPSDSTIHEGIELSLTRVARTADVQDQAREAPGTVLHSNARKFLERLDGRRVG